MDTIISEGEAARVCMALARGQGSFTEEQALQVIQWAERVRVDAIMLDMVLSGQVKLSIAHGGPDDGEILFQNDLTK